MTESADQRAASVMAAVALSNAKSVAVGHQGLAQKFAEVCQLPYRTELEGPEGWPTSFNDMVAAPALISKAVALWYNFPSMNLVVENEDGSRVGVRSMSMARQLRNVDTTAAFLVALGLDAEYAQVYVKALNEVVL
jgi:hypothetical protein